MKYCPITYDMINNQSVYSQRGLRLLSPKLKDLQPLPLSAVEQRQEAIARAGKMSIQGIQTKLSARLSIKEERFDLVDQYGQYILKTPSSDYPELPENEGITMTLASTIGIEVPVHGLIYSKDNSMTYFIKRFDRAGHSKQIALEDFSQLLGLSRDNKYDSSMEQVIKVIKKYCTFPKIELVKLFKLTLFNYLIGNEDMHLKNFSLITHERKITLAPAYDLLNTSIALQNPHEELALPLNGKKRYLTKRDFFDYFAIEKLELNQLVIQQVVATIKQKLPYWQELIGRSYLSAGMQKKYLALLNERCDRLGWL